MKCSVWDFLPSSIFDSRGRGVSVFFLCCFAIVWNGFDLPKGKNTTFKLLLLSPMGRGAGQAPPVKVFHSTLHRKTLFSLLLPLLKASPANL